MHIGLALPVLFENRASLFKKNSESTAASKHLRAVKVLSPTLLAEEAPKHSAVVISVSILFIQTFN